MSRNRPRWAVATFTGAVSLALLHACSSSSSSEASSCVSLASCCESVPAAEQSSCDSVVSGNDNTNCAVVLSSYAAFCDGTTTSTDDACTDLSLCCSALPAAEVAACKQAAALGLSSSCSDALTALEQSGECAAHTSDGGGRDEDGGGGGSDDGGESSSSFGPGDGGACTATVGGYPSPECDPSDEAACGTSVPSGCAIDAKCGDPTTCEPFTTNPAPGSGVDSFRMRLVNITAPSSLTSAVVQTAVITSAVDLPASLASCGEDGQGTLNWLLQVDQAHLKVTTGGAPYSSDPFGAGYCFIHGNVAGVSVAPVSMAATFTGSTFSTASASGPLNLPIFLTGGTSTSASVLLPIRGASFHDVAVSAGGNCIGSVHNDSLTANSGGACTDPNPVGEDSCSRWHSAGAVAGFINLADADAIDVLTLGGESLCALLTGQSDGANPPRCPASAKASGGDYCSTTQSPGGCNDSLWFSAQFAASAVTINSGSGVTLCGG